MTQNLTPEAVEIRNLFDRIATEYDTLNDNLSLGLHRIWKMMAVKWSNPHPGDTALDICCGSGDLALMLAKKVGTGGKVIGLDFACKQLEIAAIRQQKQYANFPLEWIEGDALNLPFNDNYFDCATMGYGLRNVTDIPLCLKEIHRVLKPNGYISILDFHHPDSEYVDAFQKWYLNNIVIPTAQGLNMTEEYTYLIPSLAKFPKGRKQVELAYSAGFTEATHYPLMGGMMGVLVLKK